MCLSNLQVISKLKESEVIIENISQDDAKQVMLAKLNFILECKPEQVINKPSYNKAEFLTNGEWTQQ